MSVHTTPTVKPAGSPDERDVRALTQYLTVLPVSSDLYEVVSQSGRAYVVDAREGVCTCADFAYRRPDGGCKHVRRVAFATGERPVPADVDPAAIDEHLGRHVGSVAVADGGAADPGDDPVVLGPWPAITEHVEPYEQGARRYHRCEGCGRETIYGPETIVHAVGCPRREGSDGDV